MKRIENSYCWNTLGDWYAAYQQQRISFIEDTALLRQADNRKHLFLLMQLANVDCFPLVIFCFVQPDGRLEVQCNLLHDFFVFLENKDRKSVNATSKARVYSVWVEV